MKITPLNGRVNLSNNFDTFLPNKLLFSQQTNKSLQCAVQGKILVSKIK